MSHDDAMEWIALVNGEEQYSLWPAANSVPEGWRAVTQPGSREATMAFVDTSWTDMRPLSVRAA